MTAPKQLDENLGGALDMMLGRESGIDRIDRSADGILWSCSGLVLAGLVDAVVLNARFSSWAISKIEDPPSQLYYVVATLLINLTAYAVSMGLLYLLARQGDERLRFSDAFIANNWAAPIVSIAMLPILLLFLSTPQTVQAGEGSSALAIVQLSLIVILAIIGCRILRISLQIDTLRAIWLFAVTTAVSIVTVEGLERMLGL